MLSTKLGFKQSTYFQPYVAFEDVLWDDNSLPLDSRMAAVMVNAVCCRDGLSILRETRNEWRGAKADELG